MKKFIFFKKLFLYCNPHEIVILWTFFSILTKKTKAMIYHQVHFLDKSITPTPFKIAHYLDILMALLIATSFQQSCTALQGKTDGYSPLVFFCASGRTRTDTALSG